MEVSLNCLDTPAGIGKSTLLGLISGSLEPTKGTITRNAKVRMAVFSQHHVDGLDLALTPLAYMLASFPNTKDQEHRWAPHLWLCHSPSDPLGTTSLPWPSTMFIGLT